MPKTDSSEGSGSKCGWNIPCRTEVDQQKLGSALLITASLILGMRTIRWEATHSDGLAGEEWEKEVEHSARVAKRIRIVVVGRYLVRQRLYPRDERRRFVIDANIVQGELRWGLNRRKKSNRTNGAP